MKQISLDVWQDGDELHQECQRCKAVSLFGYRGCKCFDELEDMAELEPAEPVEALQAQLQVLTQLVTQLAGEVNTRLVEPLPDLNAQEHERLMQAGSALKLIQEAQAVKAASKSVQEHKRAEQLEAAACDISGVPDLSDLKRRLGIK